MGPWFWLGVQAKPEVTVAVQQKRRSDRQSRRRGGQLSKLEIVADEQTLTPFGGTAVVGELVRRLELVPALDRAPKIGHLAPIKVRDRGASPGELLVALADSMLCGGDALQDLEPLRSDAAGAELRAVAEIPAASTAAGLARRFRRTHLRAAEAAFARAANHFDQEIGRDAGNVTLDFDSSQVEVYGRKKPGASVNSQGQLAYQPLLAVWAERGRTLATELLAGSASTKGEESRALLRRTLAHLPAGHGEVSVRLDSGFYRIDLLCDCRERGARFSVSVPRSSAMWAALEAIEEEDWRAAEAMERAEVAETTYRPAGWKAEPLRLIVRRVAHRVAEGSARPAPAHDPRRAARHGHRGPRRPRLRLLVRAHRQARDDRRCRAPPPRVRPGRGAHQGPQARRLAAPPALLRPRGQPRLAPRQRARPRAAGAA
jgi:hypothetical protein